jgi:hypothetical protein
MGITASTFGRVKQYFRCQLCIWRWLSCPLHDTFPQRTAVYTLHQQSVVECIPSAANVPNYSLPRLWAVFLSCHLQTSIHTRPPPPTHTRRRNYKYFDQMFWDPALRCVLHCYNSRLCSTVPKKSVLYCILPKFSLVTLPEQSCIPQMLHHQARRVSESETVPYKKLIRQTFGSQTLEPELAKLRSLSTRLFSL